MAAIRRRSGKPDANMPEIRDYLRKRGCLVYTMPPDAGFDLLVGIPFMLTPAEWKSGELVAVEVKDGTKPPSARKLTEREVGTLMDFESAILRYVVVTSIEDAKRLLGGGT